MSGRTATEAARFTARPWSLTLHAVHYGIAAAEQSLTAAKRRSGLSRSLQKVTYSSAQPCKRHRPDPAEARARRRRRREHRGPRARGR
eukprot:3335397-Prymnesium_polylepis.1